MQEGRQEEARQNGDMSHILNPEEFNILTVLAGAFPQKLHLHELALRTTLSTDQAKLLETVDGLIVRRLIECTPLRGPEGLADAANIVISETGSKVLDELNGEALDRMNQEDEGNKKLQLVKATILNVLIASPSDVSAEREVVKSAIDEWNASHYARMGIMLHPVRWETHSYPAPGDRPQAILNKQIVEPAHFLIGIFGNRLGSPTGEAQSGTIEEIEQFRKTGRYVALYFSNAAVPRNADRDQFEALVKYQAERQQDTLCFPFDTPEQLRKLVTQHLPKIVYDVSESLKHQIPKASAKASDRGLFRDLAPQSTLVSEGAQPARHIATSKRPPIASQGSEDLNAKEIELLWTAAKDPHGEILHSQTLDGEDIRSNGRHFLKDANARTTAQWLGALRCLEDRGFLEPLSSERDFFKVTDKGYESADQLDEFARWSVEAIVLRAHYANAASEEHTFACKGIIAIPARYYADRVGADGSVMRSLKERRSLLVEGINPKPPGNWTPNEVEFVDKISGQVERFRVDGMQFVPPADFKISTLG